MTTTLNNIHDNDPCDDGWNALLASLNKTQPDDVPVSMRQMLRQGKRKRLANQSVRVR